MNRRSFLVGVAAIGTAIGTRAQPTSAPRIGWISYTAPGFALDAKIAEFALKERLLAVSGWAQFAHAGFLATYGPNLDDVYRHLSVYADRLLQGARAESLPVELPTRIELVVNMKTAKSLGLTVPQSLLLRADEVIQ